MDIKREIRVAVNTGEVDFGLNEALENIKEEKSSMLIVASNCPDERMLERDELKGIPLYHFRGDNQALGAAAGKPFAISIISVLDAGDSNILSLRAE